MFHSTMSQPTSSPGIFPTDLYTCLYRKMGPQPLASKVEQILVLINLNFNVGWAYLSLQLTEKCEFIKIRASTFGDMIEKLEVK